VQFVKLFKEKTMPLFSDDLFLGAGATYMGTGTQSATAVISATISGNVMRVAQYLSGEPLSVGQYITGSSVTANSYITVINPDESYTLSQSSTVSSAETMYAAGNALLGDPAPMSLGVGPLGRLYVWDTIPQALQAANIAPSQTPNQAGNLTLAPGVSSIRVFRSTGLPAIQVDVPRAISITQVSSGNVVTFTVSGVDYYGQAMTQTVTSIPGDVAYTLKAFYQVTNIAVSGATGTAVTVGTSDVLGIPVRVIDAGYLVSIGWANALARDTGGNQAFVPAATATATASTGDVRGTYQPSTSTNGSARLVVAIAVPAIAVGPYSTRQGALGVTQA
jgi:hypothetical protein